MINQGRPSRITRPRQRGPLPPRQPDSRSLAWRNAWLGQTVFVLASGPSLTADDVARVRAEREGHDAKVVVANTSFRLAPWADALFFHDSRWWQVHAAEVRRDFQGVIATVARVPSPEVITFAIPAYQNSGAGAISLALYGGARRVICLGLDGQYGPHGETHWHGSHPKPLGDAKSLPVWLPKFADLAADAQALGVEVLNASRATAITCFPRITLTEALA